MHAWEVRYDAAAYTLAQLHFAALALTCSDDDCVWRTWRELLHAAPWGTAFDEVEVEVHVESMTGSSVFFDQWVEETRIGTPLLKLAWYQWDEIDRNEGRDACDVRSFNGWAVEQVQDDLYGWPLFDIAPFFVLCADDQDATITPFADCPAAASGRRPWASWDDPSQVLGEFAHPLGAPAANDPLPFYISLISDSALLPESPSSTVPVRRVCALGTCGDADADCWVSPGDCDDASAAINPAVVDDPGGVDKDCDGWGNP